MITKDFQGIEAALLTTRETFRKITGGVRSLLDDSFALYFDFMTLTESWIKSDDEEVYAVEILAVVVRRIVASLALLESGLPQEAHMILRNALELMLVSIDVTYDEQSLEKWKATAQEALKKSDHKRWYFTPKRILERITASAGGVYPAIERALASDIYSEWKLISNISLHAHSYAQIRSLSDGSGNFQLLGLRKADDYAKDFRQYGVLLFNVVSILMGIPRYRTALENLRLDSTLGKRFPERYVRVRNRCTGEGLMYVKVNSKQELQVAVRDTGYPFDISAIPDDAIIESVTFDFSDPADPKMVVDYRIAPS